MSTHTPRDIARLLTPAERLALLWLPANGTPRQESKLAGSPSPTAITALGFHRAGRMVVREPVPRVRGAFQIRATPLGVQVHAALRTSVPAPGPSGPARPSGPRRR